MEIQIKKITKKELKDFGIENWQIWEKEPSNFDWEYIQKERCYIIEGKAKIMSNTQEVEIQKEDMVIFPKGLKCKWEIIEKIKKYYTFE